MIAPVARALLAAAATLLLAGAAVLGYIAVVALRRGEAVFLPAGYVALICLAGCLALARLALRV